MGKKLHPELVRSIASRAKQGLLSDSDILELLLTLRSQEPNSHRVSWLRFLHRWARGSKSVEPIIRKEIAEVYLAESESTSSNSKRVSFLAWAKFYGIDVSALPEAERVLLEQLRSIEEPREKLAILVRSDIPVSLDNRTVSASFPQGVYRFDLETDAPGDVSALATICGGCEGDVRLDTPRWVVRGHTSVGHASKHRNEDSITVATQGLHDHILVAVADGTGHSREAHRASCLATATLLRAFAANVNSSLAVELAAAAVRVDNRLNDLDGATTLTAIWLMGDAVSVAMVGDSPYVLHLGESSIVRSHFSKSGRLVLGGEPLGGTMTSTGNYIYNLVECPADVPQYYSTVRQFVIGSDGILLAEADEEVEQIAHMLVSSQSAPADLLSRYVNRAIRAFDTDESIADNVSVLVGASI